MLIVALFLLSGCVSADDPLIGQSTSFDQIYNAEGFFNSIFVFPISQLINNLTPTLGVVGAVGLVTLVFNLVILAMTFKSSEQTQALQTMQPELNKLQKKYEGKTDQQSRMRMAQEQQNIMKKHGITNPLAPLLGSVLPILAVFVIYPAVRRAEAVATLSNIYYYDVYASFINVHSSIACKIWC